MKERKKQVGQSVFEYTAIFAVVAAALLVMQIYIKRAVSGHLRKSMDSLADPYAPRHTTSTVTVVVTGATISEQKVVKDKNIGAGLIADVTVSTVTQTAPEVITRNSTETQGAFATEQVFE